MKISTGKIQTFPLPIRRTTSVNLPQTYSVSCYILMFFTISGIGWIWEVLIHIAKDGMIINRGVLTGPWLPIYGTGGLFILLLLKKWHNHPVHLFGAIMVMCGILEYTTSFMLEHLFGASWWDYSDLIFQIHGRVCLGGLLIFGVGGLFIVYIAAPMLNRIIQKISHRARILLCGLLVIMFVCDLILSFFNPNIGFGITY